LGIEHNFWLTSRQ